MKRESVTVEKRLAARARILGDTPIAGVSHRGLGVHHVGSHSQRQAPATTVASLLAHPDYVGELPLEETAAIIARSAGVLGTNRQYLENLVAQIEHLDIEDAYMTQLLKQVRMDAAA